MDLLKFVQWFSTEPLENWGHWKDHSLTTRRIVHHTGRSISCTRQGVLGSFYGSEDGVSWKQITELALDRSCPLAQLQARLNFSKSAPVCAHLEHWCLQQGLSGQWMLFWKHLRPRVQLCSIPNWEEHEADLPAWLVEQLLGLNDLLLPQADATSTPYVFTAEQLVLTLPASQHGRLERLHALGDR